MEVYLCIFKNMGFDMATKGYFLFANATKNRPGFHGKLEFENSIIEYDGNINWVEPAIIGIKDCLESEEIPKAGKDCQYCSYRKLISTASLKNQLSLI